jgi:hypothetical protein
MQDDPPYYSPSGFVYVGEHALELGAIWDGVEAAERAGVALDQIGLAHAQLDGSRCRAGAAQRRHPARADP